MLSNINYALLYSGLIICKERLLVMPTQFGKTFNCINNITKELKKDKKHGKSLHIIFTMNTLLNGRQFSKRVTDNFNNDEEEEDEIENDSQIKELKEEYGVESIVVLSSKYTGNCTHAKNLKELKAIVCDKGTCPCIIVACSNSQRFSDIYNLINIIERNKGWPTKRIFMHLDELHSYINKNIKIKYENDNKKINKIMSLREIIKKLIEKKIVKQIIGLTATPYNVFEDNYYIEMIKLDDINYDNYVGTSDIIFKEFDSKGEIEFIKYIIDNNPTILNGKQRIFAPAKITKKSHEEVKRLFLEKNKNIVVILLNGDNKHIIYYTDSSSNETKTIELDVKKVKKINKKGIQKTIDKNDDEYDVYNNEVCDIISHFLKKHNLLDRPIIYTGHICISMGQTLVNETIGSFTEAIIGHTQLSDDDLYQLFGRLTGRMKNWLTYVKTTVYTTKKNKEIIIDMEKASFNLMNNNNGEYVNKSNYISCLNNINNKKEKNTEKPLIEIFNKFTEIKPWFNEYDENKPWFDENRKCIKRGPNKPNKEKKTNSNGFYTCITQIDRVFKVRDTKHFKEIEKLNNWGFTKGKNDNLFRCYPCYRDINDINSLEWWFVYYKK